jgi:Ferritin-like domain
LLDHRHVIGGATGVQGARTFTRKRFIAGSAGVAGVAAVSVAAGVEMLSGKGGSLQDADPLALALALEQLQAAFYAEAVSRGALSGELRDFAATAADHEAEHAALLTPLVPNPAPEAAYDFGDDTVDPKAFAAAAASLEDLAVAAYNGIIPGLSERGLATAGRIVSVAARHATWIRAINGEDPAAEPTDPGLDARQVVARLEATGYLEEATP